MKRTIRTAQTAAWSLLAAQVVHGFIPSKTSTHSVVGPIVGLVFLVATIVAIVGLHRRREFAVGLLRWTGGAVAIGFVLYHALPWKTPMTRPYIGESVGAPAWIGVAIAVAAGAWAVAICSGRSRASISATAATT